MRLNARILWFRVQRYFARSLCNVEAELAVSREYETSSASDCRLLQSGSTNVPEAPD